MNRKSRICIIHTGGTLGMRQGDRGFETEPGLLARQMSEIQELRDPTMPLYDVVECERLLDSSEMRPSDWQDMAKLIEGIYDDFDGFVLIHGTDTMSYTASALAFMLHGLAKPVILTGSQLPLGLRRNDARENLITAMILASEYPIREVCLYFGGRLLRGCRSTKFSTSSFRAFDSPNFPPLGLVGTEINVFINRFRQPDSGEFRISPINVQRVSTFRLFPGVSAQVLENLLVQPLQALVLESYGVGNGPTNTDFVNVLREATERGMIIVNCSQCTHGCVDMDDYATGKAIADAGVISGFDITTEAAITKLMYLLTGGLNSEQVRTKMQQDLAGELSVE